MNRLLFLQKGPDLLVDVVDDRGRALRRYVRPTLADWNGCEAVAIDDPPTDRLGYYRVTVHYKPDRPARPTEFYDIIATSRQNE